MIYLCLTRENDVFSSKPCYVHYRVSNSKLLIFKRKTSKLQNFKISIRRSPYLRNRTSRDHDFWYTCIKWWYLQQLFSFFQNSDFSGFWEAGRGTGGTAGGWCDKRRKMTHNYQFQSATHYISRIVNLIKIFGTKVNSCSSNSSINAIKKFWGVPLFWYRVFQGGQSHFMSENSNSCEHIKNKDFKQIYFPCFELSTFNF